MENQSHPAIAMETISIMPNTLDEWYGIEIEFSWRDAPLDQATLTRLEDDPSTFTHLLTTLQTSAAWREFYAESHFVRCENGYDEERRTVRIPEFLTGDDLTVKHLEPNGGSLFIHTR